MTMKKIVRYSILILILCVTTLSCKKQTNFYNPLAPPPPPSPTAPVKKGKARVVEYGTDMPLPEASVEAWLKNGRMLHLVTDKNGEFLFDGNEIGLGCVGKAGYFKGLWNINVDPMGYYLNAPITFFPNNDSFYYHSGYISSCDSFVVKLFPKKYITIHIKDSLGLCVTGDCNVIFTTNALFNQQGTSQTVVEGAGGIPNPQNRWFTWLRPYIDTTFQYPVCGNAVNTFTIGDFAFDSGWFANYLSRDTILIPNSDDMILNITY
jgi:hypothetical protein